jgi:hypothetical protein
VGEGAAQLATMILVAMTLLLVVVFLTFSSFIAHNISTDGFTNGFMNASKVIEEKEKEKERGLKAWTSKVVGIMTPKVKIMLTVYQIISNLPFALDIQYTEVAAKLFYAFR